MFKKLIAVSVIITFIAACDAINPFSPKTTHTMEEVVKDAKGLFYYEGDTITLKATVERVDGYGLELRTYDPDVVFYVYSENGEPLTDLKEYKAGETYTLTLTITNYGVDWKGDIRIDSNLVED